MQIFSPLALCSVMQCAACVFQGLRDAEECAVPVCQHAKASNRNRGQEVLSLVVPHRALSLGWRRRKHILSDVAATQRRVGTGKGDRPRSSVPVPVVLGGCRAEFMSSYTKLQALTLALAIQYRR